VLHLDPETAMSPRVRDYYQPLFDDNFNMQEKQKLITPDLVDTYQGWP